MASQCVQSRTPWALARICSTNGSERPRRANRTPNLKLSNYASGNFFADALPAADAYLLMEVVHDWNDQDAAKILAAVRRAASEHARLLIIEALVSESPGPHFSKVLDILMLALTGGRERTP